MILTFALESGRKATIFKDKTMIEAVIMTARFFIFKTVLGQNIVKIPFYMTIVDEHWY